MATAVAGGSVLAGASDVLLLPRLIQLHQQTDVCLSWQHGSLTSVCANRQQLQPIGISLQMQHSSAIGAQQT